MGRSLEGKTRWSSRFHFSPWLGDVGIVILTCACACVWLLACSLEVKRKQGFGVAFIWTDTKSANLHLGTSVVLTCWKSVRICASYPTPWNMCTVWMDGSPGEKNVFIRAVVLLRTQIISLCILHHPFFQPWLLSSNKTNNLHPSLFLLVFSLFCLFLLFEKM